MDEASLRTTAGLPADRPGLERQLGTLRRLQWVRRALLAVPVLVTAAALVGLLGVSTTSVTSTAAGDQLTVTYPRIARPGLAVVWRVELVRSGGFGAEASVRVDRRYFAAFDENAVDPQPDSVQPDGDAEIWVFAEPEGSRLVIELDARVSPTWQWPVDGRVDALAEDGSVTASVTFSTLLLP